MSMPYWLAQKITTPAAAPLKAQDTCAAPEKPVCRKAETPIEEKVFIEIEQPAPVAEKAQDTCKQTPISATKSSKKPRSKKKA